MTLDAWIFRLVTAGIGPAAWLEIAWTLAGVFGLAFVIRNIRYTRFQDGYLRRQPAYQPRGPRAEVIRMYRSEEEEKVVTFLVVIGLGVIGLITPPPVSAANATAGGIFALVILAFVWYLVHNMRRRLRIRIRVHRLLVESPPSEEPHDPP